MKLLLLALALCLLMIDSAIELALISSMVGYLHVSGANQYPFLLNDGTSHLINAKPHGLLLNQGHTSNGAAGSSLVLICFGGAIVLWLQHREDRRNSTRRASPLFLGYTVLTILCTLLTLAALAYTFAVTNQTKGQSIDKVLAAQTQGHAYPKDKWTPETWTKALLAMPVTSRGDRHYLQYWLRIMDGWKWNLIPMFLINILVSSLFTLTYFQRRRLSANNYKSGVWEDIDISGRDVEVFSAERPI
ncbi:hypothetical protein B7463_g10225, partial [Scytalidium lignicola]